MKNKQLVLLTAILLLSIVIPAKPAAAGPAAQQGDQLIQIVLVLDVSGSMSTPVYTGIVPEDLLSLLLRMDELTSDPEYIDLQEQIEDAENESAVKEARDAQVQAFEDLAAWIEESQGTSLAGIQAIIRSLLRDNDCQDSSDRLIATAADSDQIIFYLNADCPPTAEKWTLLNTLLELLPYQKDPEYLSLREQWQAAYRAYDQALDESGYTSLSDQLESYKLNTGLEELQVEIDQLVETYGIPSRLELAKTAAVNLIDLAYLDQENTGRQSEIGLVTFSNQGFFEQGLTQDHEILKPLIQSLAPLYQTNIGDGLMLGLQELETNADPKQPLMVILLSDGHANVGMSSSAILSTVPERANQNEIILCTAGFADLETEVDFLLLEGLAYKTGGEYLFTNSGAELGSFFAACREAAAGKYLAGQITGIISAGDNQEVGSVEVENNACELSFVLNYLSGSPTIELVGPDGNNLDLDGSDISYQTSNQVQLLTVTFPEAGEWTINVSNKNDQEDAAYSLVISTTPCQGDENRSPEPEIAEAEIPFLFTDRGLTILTAGLIAVVFLLGGAVGLVIRIRQRRAS